MEIFTLSARSFRDSGSYQVADFDRGNPDCGESGPGIAHKGRTVNAILLGLPRRVMPERFGNLNSVFVRFSRLSKLGTAVEALAARRVLWAA
jgi:hypothetical protein